MSRFRFVEEDRALYEVKRLCELVEMSTSGFYARKTSGPSDRDLTDAELLVEIRDIHTASRCT